jgi:hypothetical protein
MPDHRYGYWFLCVGCGQPIGLFPDGCEELGLEPGTVCHSKPERLAGQPGTVPCALYQNTSAEKFAALHAGKEEIEPPTRMSPINRPD